MVLIFALPRPQGADRTNSTGETIGHVNGTTTDNAPPGRTRARRDVKEGDTSESTAPLDSPPSETPAISPPAPTPRRTRSRTRKTARPAPEPAPEPVPAAWLQVAPGKFVRADAQPTAASTTPEPHAPIESVAPPLDEVVPEKPEEPSSIAEPAPADDELTETLSRKWEREAPAELRTSEIPARQEPRPPENNPSGTGSESLPAPEPEIPVAEPCATAPDFDIPVAEPCATAPDSSSVAAPELRIDDDADRLIQHRVRLVYAARSALTGRRRANLSQRLRNVSSGPIRPGSARFDRGAGARWRARSPRRSERLSRTHRHFLPRSPPRRA